MKAVNACAWTLLALLVPISSGAEDDGAGFYYYYFKERIPLEAWGGRVAVYDERELAPAALDGLLDAAGYPGARLRRHALRYWWVAEIRSASDSPIIEDGESVGDIIARLVDLDRPSRFFFSPMFHSPGAPADERGGLILKWTIFVQFEPGVSAERVDEILEGVGLADAPREEPFASLDRLYSIDTGLPWSIPVLDVANCLAVMPEVSFAEPGAIISGGVLGGPVPEDIPTASWWGLWMLGLALAGAAVPLLRRG